MKMSPEGKQFVEQVIEQVEGATLRFYGVAGCCGMNLGAEIAQAKEEDSVQTIEGIEIAVDPQIAEQLTDVTIHAEEENGQLGLVLLGYEQSSC
ncbi:Fe-S cluster assembly protein HesB [Lysinibacillus sp. 2017]|uniref:Fe-S cluster assembly protein HesB n=1 Tax=unclassified Lysinibacillus TaxID=2636778 RepID=UPI000D526FDB|nr:MULTISPECIES: Fe-S cluster assembly protein HesB [unclassified Lysinibacillus]AWE07509.1 Fe-S cluster assembly protein HesB [Lysinibacillus sp. 2017]TGN36671.1 Fe-S cluster assembly protein HesB [Lysinibacillus sp. S2017]